MSLELQHNSKLIWIIAAVIVLIAGGLFAAQWYVKQQKATQLAQQQAQQQAALAATAQAATAAPASAPESNTPATTETDASISLVDDSLASAPIPSNPSLAKEEVAKLQDIQKQLQDQQKSLESQHADADQLIKLKEEQVKLLEAQLAAQ